MRSFVVIFAILGMGGTTSQPWTNSLAGMWNMWGLYTQSSTPSSEKNNNCHGCVQNSIVIDDDLLLTEARVEYVKEQILRKLRLPKPPTVSMPLSTLPKPLINGNVLDLQPGAPPKPENSAENFYGKTDQVVLFPHEGKTRANRDGRNFERACK